MASKEPWVPERGEVIWMNFNPSGGGQEMADEHPMLVLSTRIFNDRTSLVIGLPMTHAESNKTNPFAVEYTFKGHTGYFLTHQPKSFDWRKRGSMQLTLGKIPEHILQKACEALNDIIQIG